MPHLKRGLGNAGFAGAALGIKTLAHQLQDSSSKLPSVETFTDGRGYYLNEDELVNQIREDLAKAEKALGRKPTALVLGALGRCGKGAVDLFLKAGMPDENITRWDLNETKDRDGPYEEIAKADVFLNAIYLSKPIPPFINQELLAKKGRNLAVVIDVSCDTTNPHNPIPIYSINTTFEDPTVPVEIKDDQNNLPLSVISIDHLPSMLPREASEAFSEVTMASSDKNDTVVESIEDEEASEVTHSGAVDSSTAESAAQPPRGCEVSNKIEQATAEASKAARPAQSPRILQPRVSQSPRSVGRPLAPAQVQHAQMVQPQSARVAQSPHHQMPQSPHQMPPSPYMAQHPNMGYAHTHHVPHSPYMAQSPHQMPQSPHQMPQSPYQMPHSPHPHMPQSPHPQMAQSPHPHMPQSPHPQMAQSPHPQIPPSPYMVHPHYAPQPGHAPPQSPLFTPQGTPIMTPQQSPLFTPLATPRFTPTPTPGPQSAAPTPAPSATPAPSSVSSTPAPHSVASTPAPSSIASTPAPESSSRGQVTYDMGPPPKKKRGPKPKPLSERKLLRTTPIVRKEASYSKRKKEEVIAWMLHTRVDRRGEMVPPSTTDAENHFQIPRSTIAGWKKMLLGLGPIPKVLPHEHATDAP
ncbi:ubiquitin thiolesterase [Fusarium tjaetaba]|uniref:Saccharopine dehydrogenase [NAD(+), L-lysine-forming] n=1 Tax=Fusarium tjaetaba TaxID=1567544 RepID=A0A8H5S8U7_9HYPO|nr:ubiquitin thiolesterase [Fusarium tjaetaba]KAF5646673.1 ubiquitin thiolesterase [Fusarium tjaetaba]